MALGHLRGALMMGALLACAAILPAAAETAEAASMLAWGTAHADCAEWSDSCQVCARGANGAPQCSTPGIACSPGPVVCHRPMTPAEVHPGK